MASLENLNLRVFNVSPNIVLSVDDHDVGEMYVYGARHKYILNGASAKDLVNYFACDGRVDLADEVLDFVLSVTVNATIN